MVLDQFLTGRLQDPCRHRIGHAGRILIEGPTRDDIFKTSEWFAHRNPLNRKLAYSVVGYEHRKISFLSYCPRCRRGEGPHYEHSGVA